MGVPVRIRIVIEAETDNVEYPLTPDGPVFCQSAADLIESLERTVPYMFDNVVVSSSEIT